MDATLEKIRRLLADLEAADLMEARRGWRQLTEVLPTSTAPWGFAQEER